MASKLELLLEAERRGLLPPEKVAALAEARKRGLITAPAGFDTNEDWQRQAAMSASRARLEEHPWQKGVIDFATGATGILRGALNAVTPNETPKTAAEMIAIRNRGVLGNPAPTLSDLITGEYKVEPEKQPGWGDKALPFAELADKSSGMHLVGALMDPAAWAIGGGGLKAGQTVFSAAKPIVQRLAGGAAGGGAIGALSEEGDAGTGAAIGSIASAVLPPALSTAIKLPSYLKNLVKPSAAQLAARAAGDKTDEVVKALMSTRSGVPGVELTAGQASVPAGSAEFAALQKLAARENPSLYVGPSGAYDAQQAARQAAIQTVGKTPAELAAAKASRAAASESAYQQAFAVPIKPDTELVRMSRNPFFDAARRDALKLAQAQGINPENDLTAFLHLVKLSMDDMLQRGKAGATAMGDTERRAITTAQKELVSWIGRKNPAYEAARAQHAELSKPITQMKLGQELEQSLVAPTGGERAGAFASAVRKAETQVSKASGKPRIEAMTPAQRQVVDAMVEDLQRDTTWKRMAAAGMKNMEDRVNAFQSPPTGLFSPIISAARSWFNRATGALTEQGLTELSELMVRDPQKLAVIMQQFSPSQQKVVQAMIERYTGPAVGSLVSGIEQ